MKDETLAQILPRALFVLRITLGLFVLQWGIEPLGFTRGISSKRNEREKGG